MTSDHDLVYRASLAITRDPETSAFATRLSISETAHLTALLAAALARHIDLPDPADYPPKGSRPS